MFCCPIRSALYGGCNRVKERRRFEGIVGMSIGIRQVRGWRLKLLPTLVWGRIRVFFLKREYKDKYYRILPIVIIPQVIRNKVESYLKPFFFSHMIAHSPFTQQCISTRTTKHSPSFIRILPFFHSNFYFHSNKTFLSSTLYWFYFFDSCIILIQTRKSAYKLWISLHGLHMLCNLVRSSSGGV